MILCHNVVLVYRKNVFSDYAFTLCLARFPYSALLYSHACNHSMNQIFWYLLFYLSSYPQIETFLREVGILIVCIFVQLMSSTMPGIKYTVITYFLKMLNIYTLLYLATFRSYFTFLELPKLYNI